MITIKPIWDAPELLVPRRVRRYVLIWCSSGTIDMQIDEHLFRLHKNNVTTITSGQVHCIKKNIKASGYVLEFTYDFFCKDDFDIELVFHNSLFCHFGMNEVTLLGSSKVVETELQTMEKELSSKPYQYLITAHSRLKLILVEINRQKLKLGHEVYKPDALFLSFLEAIRNNFEKNLSAKQIASMLRTTESKLNELSKIHTGRTAESVIHGLIASEAKRLFTYEKLSVKQAAFALGFKDPFYFSNFFKKQTKQSPKSYRDKVQR